MLFRSQILVDPNVVTASKKDLELLEKKMHKQFTELEEMLITGNVRADLVTKDGKKFVTADGKNFRMLKKIHFL